MYLKVTKLSKALKCWNVVIFRKKKRNTIKKMRNSDAKLGDDKVKLARIKYRGKGRYIDEILK